MRKTRTRAPQPPTFSLTEAAFVTGLPVKAINQAIDRQEIAALRGRGAKPVRRIGFAEMLYLCLRQFTAPALSKSGRAALYIALRQLGLDDITWESLVIDLVPGAVQISLGEIPGQVRARLTALHRSAALVVSDPDIRGGEPVVRDTRVPVYAVAEMKAQGAPDSELLEDFPSLTPESLDAALTYAATHPRRGRPKRGPWHTAA
jgi:uncharacterized protein (DUF433 family)